MCVRYEGPEGCTNLVAKKIIDFLMNKFYIAAVDYLHAYHKAYHKGNQTGSYSAN